MGFRICKYPFFYEGAYIVPLPPNHPKVQKTASEALKSEIAAKSGWECIQIGQKYDVGPWIKLGLYLLIQQKTPLDFWVMDGEWGSTLRTIGLIYHYRDQALVETQVNVAEFTSIPFSTRNQLSGWRIVPYFDRKVEEMKEGAEKMFASEYSAYRFLGKDDLDLDNLFST